MLPPALKEKVTNDWDELINGDREWMKSYNHSQKFMDRSFERWKKFGDNVINYMNGEDWYHYWDDFIEYANAQDQHHETNILDVYPEFSRNIGMRYKTEIDNVSKFCVAPFMRASTLILIVNYGMIFVTM